MSRETFQAAQVVWRPMTAAADEKVKKTAGSAASGAYRSDLGRVTSVKLFILNELTIGSRAGGENVLNLNKMSQCYVIFSELLLSKAA